MFFGKYSIFHENQAFSDTADRSKFLKLYQKKGFHEVLNYGETKFESIRTHYVMLTTMNKTISHSKKSSTASDSSRNAGNTFFFKKQYRQALDSYNRALCLAETKSQRSLCYGNISAIYCALKNPNACLANIKMAKKMHTKKEAGVDKFLEKLNSREKECEHMIQIPGLENLKLSYPEHENIPGLCNKVGIREQHTKNQHLYAKESMKYGDIIAITESIQVGVDEKLGNDLGFLCYSAFGHFCYNCGIKTYYVAFPCDSCSFIQFCSESCKSENMAALHSLECENIHYCQFQFEVEKILAIRLAYRFLKAGIEAPPAYTSCFDWTEKGATLADKAKSILGFRDSVVSFDDAFLVTKRTIGLRDMFREKQEYKDLVDSPDKERKLWDLYGKIYRKMGSGSFFNNMTEVMQTESRNILDYTTNVDWLHGLLKHSCLANVMVFRPKHSNKNFYILMDDVKAGQELNISYM